MQYSKQQKEDIFERILIEIRNGRALRNILKEDKGMIHADTFYQWIDKDKELAERYARACEFRADAIFEEILQIADETSNDTIIDEKGREKQNSEWVNRSRLRVDARKWIVAKLHPKKYGDRIE